MRYRKRPMTRAVPNAVTGGPTGPERGGERGRQGEGDGLGARELQEGETAGSNRRSDRQKQTDPAGQQPALHCRTRQSSVVGLGQRVQARVQVRQASEADAAGGEEGDARKQESSRVIMRTKSAARIIGFNSVMTGMSSNQRIPEKYGQGHPPVDAVPCRHPCRHRSGGP